MVVVAVVLDELLEALDVVELELLLDVVVGLAELDDELLEALDVAGEELLLDVLEETLEVVIELFEALESVETLLKALEVVETELSPVVVVFSAKSVLDSLVGVLKADDIDVLVVGLIDVVKLTLKVGKLVVFLVIFVKL